MNKDVSNVSTLVGVNIALYRQAHGWSQAELGKQLSEYIGLHEWARQSVSSAEKGRRAFTAAELVALAQVLEVKLADLFLVAPEPVGGEDTRTVKQKLEDARAGRSTEFYVAPVDAIRELGGRGWRAARDDHKQGKVATS